MLGRREFTDLDGAASPTTSYANGDAGANPTTQNIDLSGLNLGGATGADANTDGRVGRGDNLGTGGAEDINDATYEYEYIASPFSPAKTDRFLLENVLISFVLLLNVALGIASLATDQVKYTQPTVKIWLRAGMVNSCVLDTCEHRSVATVFCDNFLDIYIRFLAFIATAVVASGLAFVFSICSLCGRVYVSRYLVVGLSLAAWILLLAAVIHGGVLRLGALCNDVSLASLGFQYGASFALCLTSFIVLSVAILIHTIKRCVRPVKYRY